MKAAVVAIAGMVTIAMIVTTTPRGGYSFCCGCDDWDGHTTVV